VPGLSQRRDTARATIPSVSARCVIEIATGNPEVKKVADYAAARRDSLAARVWF
jgi:hypothetical protein